MKTFMVVYTGAPDSPNRAAWAALNDADRQARTEAGLKAWHEWRTAHQAAIIMNDAPLGKTKRVSKAGIEDIKNSLALYTVVQAESHEAAARMFENHPHFT